MIFFPSRFPTKPLYALLFFPIRTTCPTHPLLHDLTTRKIFGGQYRSLSALLSSLLQSSVASALLGPNILLSTLFTNTLSLRSSLSVKDQVSHPYKTTGKIRILYILLVVFWVTNWKTKNCAHNENKQFLTSVSS